MRQRSKQHNSRLAVVAIAICAMITFPLLMIPVGLRESTPAGVLVGRAYAAAYPDADQQDVLEEDWAIKAEDMVITQDQVGDQDLDPNADPDSGTEPAPEDNGLTIDPETGLIILGEGQMVGETYFDDSQHIEQKYSDIMTAMVVQTYDSANLPIELLDTRAFTPTEQDFYISTSNTILKEEPNMDSITVASIARSTKVTQIAIGDTWSLIRTAEGIEGYVLTGSLSYEMVFNDIDRTVWVDASGLKLRASPSTDAEVIKELGRWTRLHCSGIANNQWYRVTLDDGTAGYVYVSYTTQKPPPTPTPKPTPKPKSGGKKGGGSGGGGGNNNPPPDISGQNGESIVNIAKSMLGTPYVWCGESKSGVDCSGLVVYCYRQIGISVPHQSNKIRSVGTGVSRSEIKLGDVIVYDLKGSDGVADHVAIYAGNGQVIHASSSRDAVVWGNMDMGTILTIRRFVG